MEQKKIKKLTLKKETISNLSMLDQGMIIGGYDDLDSIRVCPTNDGVQLFTCANCYSLPQVGCTDSTYDMDVTCWTGGAECATAGHDCHK